VPLKTSFGAKRREKAFYKTTKEHVLPPKAGATYETASSKKRFVDEKLTSHLPDETFFTAS
jgi:hypothetical protein